MPDTNSSKEKRPRPIQRGPRIVPRLDPYEDCGISGSEMFERLQSLPSDLREAILESTMENYMENNGY
jgi:hypothetical protein